MSRERRNLKLGGALDIGNGKFCDTFVRIYEPRITCRFNFKIRRLSIIRRTMLFEIFWKVMEENMFRDMCVCVCYANCIIAILFRKVKLKNGGKYVLRCYRFALFYMCRYTNERIIAGNFGKYTSGRKYFSDLIRVYNM